jgi:ankyrin repeat protein
MLPKRKKNCKRFVRGLAAEGSYLGVVQLLLEHSADVDAKDNGEWTALHIAAQCGQEAVVQLLLDHNADVDAKDSDEWTALHVAARSRQEAVVQQLLQLISENHTLAASPTLV